MIARTATSNESPAKVQLLQGKKLINIDIELATTVVDGNEISTFSFTQLVVDVTEDTDNAILEYRADIAQKYLNATDVYFTIDKHSQLTAERISELTEAREAARVVIRKFVD